MAIFLRLAERFALGADDLQRILDKSRRKAPSPLDSRLVFGRGGEWEPVSFVSSTKEILFRCMRKAGCKPCDEAQVALAGYPDTFREWDAARHARNLYGPPSVKASPAYASPVDTPAAQAAAMAEATARVRATEAANLKEVAAPR